MEHAEPPLGRLIVGRRVAHHRNDEQFPRAGRGDISNPYGLFGIVAQHMFALLEKLDRRTSREGHRPEFSIGVDVARRLLGGLRRGGIHENHHGKLEPLWLCGRS